MFFWTRPLGMKTFGLTAEFAAASKTLAANQGLYNGFLAAGLIMGIMVEEQFVKVFFLICVILAGVYGGFTASKKILYVQALPGLLALVVVLSSQYA